MSKDKTPDNNAFPTPHDAFFKANMADKKRAIKALKQHFSPELVALIDFKTIKSRSTEFIQHNLHKVISDVLYSCKIKDKDAYLYVIWEHQSTSDALMAFRMLTYVTQIMQHHLQQGYKKLPLVLPAVIYHGKKSPYPYSTSIFDCFEDKTLAAEYAFRSFELIDLTVMSDDDLAKFDPDLMFEYMLKHSRDNLVEQLTQWLLKHPNQSVYFLSAGKNLLNQVFSYIESRKDIDQSAVDRLIEVINENTDGEFMSAPSKAKAIKLDNPAQKKASHQSGTELHIMQGNEHYEAVVRAVYQPQRE
ncbi:Rpn family recombination-promoting nuclease/putative transposase [Facilibium subflavum]|uniref:Rpn family recombination-promoting nuclease/putative transposase n=2 Tax=Facilibium subflavum TaxID=2219058 RepID=UPI000E6470F8|nr:Rpn family recombination-promoting nuclease/putative transposase [Facilibium subflavum]